MTDPVSSRLCFSTLACPEWPLETIIRSAAAAGVGGIDFRGIQDQLDITIHSAFTSELAQTITSLANTGLQLPCFNTSIKLLTLCDDEWTSAIKEWTRYAGLAKATGTKLIRVFGGLIPGDMNRGTATQLARQRLIDLCKLASAQVMPVIETHDDWRVCEEVLPLIDGLPVGVLWDIEHTVRAGESIDKTAKGYCQRIQHVHVKDVRCINGKDKPVLLGEGELPIVEAITSLSAAGYAGWFCLETERRWNSAAPPPEVSIPQFAAYARTAFNLQTRSNPIE
jgi:fatty-acyl-CoA synthase